MEEEQMQPNTEDMTPEEAKASLGIATYLQSQLMPQETPEEGDSSPGNEPGTTENPEQGQEVKAQMEGLETRILDEIKTLREEMKTQGDGKAELAELKAQIEEILNSSD